MKRGFKIWRGNQNSGEFVVYSIEIEGGMVVLDSLHKIQVQHASDMAVR